MALTVEQLSGMLTEALETGEKVNGLMAEKIMDLLDREASKRQFSPGLPSAEAHYTGKPIPPIRILDLRKFALAQAVKSGYVADPSMMLGFLTQPFLDPVVDLLRACYQVFLAQDMADHVAVFDRATDMRDAFGSVLKAMDELGMDRPGGDAESWMVKKQDDDKRKDGA